MRRWMCMGLCILVLMVEMAGCQGAPATKPLTDTQLEEIQTYLNEEANNGFVNDQYYTQPEQVHLATVFYNGAGIGTFGTTGWSDREQQDVLLACGWDEFFNPPLKLTRTAVDALVQEKLGISTDAVTDAMDGFTYLEAYDAYYTMHGDTNYSPVTVVSGETDRTGLYTVEYARYSLDGTTAAAIVTLRKTETGYRFLSNLRKED